MASEDKRLDLATIRKRSRWFWIGAVVLQIAALLFFGVLFLQDREAAWLVAALAVTPLAAVGFGLLTLYHFTVIQAQKQR